MISTTTSLASSPSSSTYGNPVTLTATVTPSPSGGPTMTGSVTFLWGSVALGSAAVSWNSITSIGTATLTVYSLPGGSDSLSAAYSGDSNYSPSFSSPFSH